MLQILLAVLAISLVSVSGWTLVEQIHLQQIVTDQRETMRRLDVAAEAVSGSLKSMPGRDGVFTLAPTLPQNGFLQMPAGVGGINANPYGMPFHYCPVVRKVDGNGNFIGYAMADAASDGITVQNNLVLDAGAAVPAVLASFNPVAFITSSKSGTEAPPSCNAIDVVDGKPHVTGGMVRIVSRPNGALAQDTASKEISNLYTAPGASGSGRYPNDPAAIDDVLEQFARYRPSAMTLHVNGVVTPSSGAWGDFVSALNGNGSALTIVGDSAGSGIEGAAGGNMPAPGTLVLQNIGMPVNVVVGTNSSVNLVGSLALANGGVVASGARSVSSGPGTSIATPNGNCWSSASGDVTFAYSLAPNSAVPTNPTAPTKPVRADGEDDADYQTDLAAYDQQYDAWRDRVTALETARQTNHSSFNCATISG